MEVIIDAKERQAAEANKNATILLQEIDLEKVRSVVIIIILLMLGACARGMVVVLCICLFVTMLAATYLVYTCRSKTRCRRVLYGIFKIFTVWLSLKTLRSRVLVSLQATTAFITP